MVKKSPKTEKKSQKHSHCTQRYTYRVLQTIQMKLILLYAKTNMKFK